MLDRRLKCAARAFAGGTVGSHDELLIWRRPSEAARRGVCCADRRCGLKPLTVYCDGIGSVGSDVEHDGARLWQNDRLTSVPYITTYL